MIILIFFVTKDIVEVSRNPLLNEPNFKIIDIPNKDKGKQFWFWIVIRDETIEIMFSGLTSSISVSHHDHQDPDEDLLKIYVSDSPFTVKRDLLTKTLYNTKSDTYKDVREFERSEGTII